MCAFYYQLYTARRQRSPVERAIMATAKAQTEFVPIPEHLLADGLWDEFLVMRKGKKGVNTPRALKAILRALSGLSSDPDTQVRIIEQSLVSGWLDVYPLKDKSRPSYSEGSSFIDRLKAREKNGN